MGNMGPIHSPHLVRVDFQKHRTHSVPLHLSQPGLALHSLPLSPVAAFLTSRELPRAAMVG